MKKVVRLWREEGRQAGVRVYAVGGYSVLPVEADAPNVVRANDFPFDSTLCGHAMKIASTIDEYPRHSVLQGVEPSIAAERLLIESSCRMRLRVTDGPPLVLRLDNSPELVSQPLQRFCENDVGPSYIPPGTR